MIFIHETLQRSKIWHTASMRIVTLTWARNEEDILEHFLRHTATFAQEMHIMLHMSRDGSLQIASSLQRQGLPIRIGMDEGVAHRQASALTELVKALPIEEDDWVVPLDADELLQSSVNIRDAIAALPTDTPTAVPWKTYLPTHRDDPAEKNPIKRITHRRSIETPQYHKMIIPGSLIRHSNCKILPGNHAVALGDELLHSTPTSALWIAHFPVRTEAQLRRKIIQGWQSVLANPQRIPGEGFHWEQLYSRCLDPRPIDTAEISRIARDYAQTNGALTELVSDPLHTSLAVA